MNVVYHVQALDGDTWRIDEELNGLHTYAYLLEGTQAALLIDSANGCGGLAQRVRALTGKPVRVVHTHGHLDHIGGDGAFGKAYLSARDQAVARAHRDPVLRKTMYQNFDRELELDLSPEELERLAGAVQGVEFLPLGGGELDLGGRRLEILPTPGHTPGSVCFLEKARRTLYTGDTVCARGILLNLDHSCSVERFGQSIRSLLAHIDEYDGIHAGHHESPVPKQTLWQYKECADRIVDGTLKGTSALAAGEGCLCAPLKDISISYRQDHVLDRGEWYGTNGEKEL